MSPSAPVDAYLAELRGLLTGPRRQRRRLLAEVEDHLRCAVEAQVTGHASGGDDRAAARRAIERFGAAEETAAAHARRLAAEPVRGLAVLVGFATALFVALFAAATQVPSVAAGLPARAVAGGLAGGAGWIACQLVAGCAVLVLVRAARLRADGATSGALGQLHRAAGTIAGALTIVLLLDLAAFTRLPAGQGQHAALIFGLALAAAAATGVLWVALLRSASRARALARLAPEPPHDRGLAELRWALLALGGRLERFPVLGALASRALSAAAGVVVALGPRRVAAGCLAVAALVALGHLVGEGPATAGLLTTLLAAGAVLAAEAAVLGVLVVAFGRFLGLTAAGAAAS